MHFQSQPFTSRQVAMQAVIAYNYYQLHLFMKKGQQQALTNNFYDYLPNITQSVLDRRDQFTTSINHALNNTLSKIGEIKTNLIYSIKHSDISVIPLIQRKQIQIRNDGSYAQLLGHRYDAELAYKFLFVYRNIFWFTYRQGIKEIQSDNGWGCMIRAMQMVFAETLKRNLKLSDKEKDQYEVIRHFSQMSQGVLSLSEICKEGNINKRWTSALEILSIFKRIMAKYPEHFKFNIEIFSSGVVYKDIQGQYFDKYPAMITLTNRVGLKDIPEQSQPHYFEMMNHPSWLGSIGGVKGQALYIIGSYDQKVIFLDPHYVQSNDEEMNVDTYFNKTPRGLDINELCPSMTYCYYVENKKQHKQWLNWVSQASKKFYPNLIFQFISDVDKAEAESKLSQLPKKPVIPCAQKCDFNDSSNQITVIIEEQLPKKESSEAQKSDKIDVVEVIMEKNHKNSQQLHNIEISNDSDEFQLLS